MSVLGTAIGTGISALTGLGQILFSKKRQKEQELESQAALQPKYAGSPELETLYQQSLQQATTPAAQTAQYKQQMNLINRQMGAGLAGARGQADVARLTQIGTDASMRALSQAENLKESRLGRLAGVTQQKAAETMRKFQINQMQPWETKYNLLAARAAQAARQQQAGLSNIAQAGVYASGLFGDKKKNQDQTTTR